MGQAHSATADRDELSARDDGDGEQVGSAVWVRGGGSAGVAQTAGGGLILPPQTAHHAYGAMDGGDERSEDGLAAAGERYRSPPPPPTFRSRGGLDGADDEQESSEDELAGPRTALARFGLTGTRQPGASMTAAHGNMRYRFVPAPGKSLLAPYVQPGRHIIGHPSSRNEDPFVRGRQAIESVSRRRRGGAQAPSPGEQESSSGGSENREEEDEDAQVGEESPEEAAGEESDGEEDSDSDFLEREPARKRPAARRRFRRTVLSSASPESSQERATEGGDEGVVIVPESPISRDRGAEVGRRTLAGEELEALVERQVNPYLKLLPEGRARIVREIYEREFEFHRGVLRGVVEALWHPSALQVLLATPDALLKALLNGNVQLVRRSDASVDGFLRDNWERSGDQLCIYVWEFVNGDGQAPTPTEHLSIVEVAERYAGNDPAEWDMVEKIDTAKPWSDFSRERLEREGRRRYLPNDHARGNLRDFLVNAKKFLRGEPKDSPLSQPFRDTGYTNNGPRRTKEHGRHSGSNYLMNLFEAISIAGGWDTRNHVSIVFLVFDRMQAAIAEIVMSCVDQSYTKTGRGFNHSPAGISTLSADKDPTRLVARDSWVQWTNVAWARQTSPFQANLRKERILVTQSQRTQAELSEELARVHAQLNGFSLVEQRELDAGGTVSVHPASAFDELHRMERDGELENNDDRDVAEDVARFVMQRELRMLQALCAEQGHILRTGRAILTEMAP